MSKMPPMHELEAKLAKAWPPAAWAGHPIVIAVSGGPDSMALLRAMLALNVAGSYRLSVAHFNHRLRGPDSEADESFVAQTAARLQVHCEIGCPPDRGVYSARGDGLEAAARQARYQFLTQVAAKLGARYVAVAHTADDQAETILHRIVRGTGIGGLSGMRRARPLSEFTSLIRPLLGFRRAELRTYLDDLGQAYRLDSTNLDPRRTRNRIRHQLLPDLAASFNPDVMGAVLRLGTLADQVQSVVRGIVEPLLDRALTESRADEACLDIDPLKGTPRYVWRELLMAVWRRQGWPLRHMGFEEWELLAATAEQYSGGSAGAPWQRTFPGRVLAEVDASRLRLRRLR